MTTNEAYSFGGGFFLSASHFILNIDWYSFAEALGLKLIEAFAIGIVGGAAGYMIKKLIDKIFKFKS